MFNLDLVAGFGIIIRTVAVYLVILAGLRLSGSVVPPAGTTTRTKILLKFLRPQ